MVTLSERPDGLDQTEYGVGQPKKPNKTREKPCKNVPDHAAMKDPTSTCKT